MGRGLRRANYVCLWCGASVMTSKIDDPDRLDAARYRWLMANKVGAAEASRDGPAHPVLYMHADIWNERNHLSARQRIEEAIDAAIAGRP